MLEDVLFVVWTSISLCLSLRSKPALFFQFYVFFSPIASHVRGSPPLDGRVLTIHGSDQ